MRHGGFGSEVGVINTHHVKDHTDAPGKGNDGALAAKVEGKLSSRYSQAGRAATVRNHSGGLTQPTAQVDVNVSGDALICRVHLIGCTTA